MSDRLPRRGVWWETALAERIPPRQLSRVSSYDGMGSLALALVPRQTRTLARLEAPA